MKKYVVLLVGIWGLGACGQPASSPVEEADTQLATQVSIFSSKENQKEWVLYADFVNFENNQSATLKNPALVLKQNGQDSARISGNTGTFDYVAQQVSIEGNAVLESFSEQIRLTASAFFYDIVQDKIWSATRTVITRGSARSVAINGVETNSKLTKITIKKHTTLLPKDARELKRKSL